MKFKFKTLLLIIPMAALSSCSLIDQFFGRFLDDVLDDDVVDNTPVVLNIDNTNPNLTSGFIARKPGTNSRSISVNSVNDFTFEVGKAFVERVDYLNVTFNYNNQLDLETIKDSIIFPSYCYGIFEKDEGTYSKGSGVTNRFILYYDDYTNYTISETALDHTTLNNKDKYTEIKNANFENRLKKFESRKRSENFGTFPIDLKTNSLPVYNSEDLWYVVSEGYKPDFKIVGETKAKAMYGRAKAICKEFISDDMTDLEKYQTLFDFMVYYTSYDYSATELPEGYMPAKNTAFHLEGTMEYNSAVCDGLSKTYALLCGIEGLPVRKASGFPASNPNSGHAWNYIKVNNKWYLACSTWGQKDDSSLSVFHTSNESYVDYSAFGAHSDYFYAVSGNDANYNFIQYAYPETLIDPEDYLDITTEKIGTESDYDYAIETVDELSEVFKKCADSCGDSSFTVTIKNLANININTAFNNSHIGGNVYSKTSSYGNEYITLIVRK